MQSVDTARQTRRRRLALGALPVLLAGAAAAIYLFPRVGRLPWDDYWGFMPQVATPHGFTHDPLRWLSLHSNEHLITVPGLVYAAIVRLFHGDNRVQSLTGIVLLVSLAVVLLRVVARGGRRVVALPALGAFIALMVFTPAGAVNLFMGFAGIHWYLADVVAVLAIALVPWAGAGHAPTRTCLLVGLGLLAALCYSSSLAVWPALLVTVLMQRRRRPRLSLVVVGAVAATVFFAATYHRPPQVPPLLLGDLPALGKFLAVFLGAPFAVSNVTAGIVGLGGLAGAAAVVVVGRRYRRRWPSLAPWAGVGTYALVNAGMAAMARAGMGGAHSSRYAVLAVLFWIALTMAALVVGGRRGRLADGALTVAMGVLALATWLAGWPLLASLSQRAARQPLAELALRYGVADQEALLALSPAPEEPWSARPWATAVRQVPFDRAGPAYGAVIEPAVRPCDVVSFDLTRTSATMTAGAMRLDGELRGVALHGARFLFVDDRNRLRGIAVAMPPAPTATRAARTPWAGYVTPVAGAGPFKIIMRIASRRPCILRHELSSSGSSLTLRDAR